MEHMGIFVYGDKREPVRIRGFIIEDVDFVKNRVSQAVVILPPVLKHYGDIAYFIAHNFLGYVFVILKVGEHPERPPLVSLLVKYGKIRGFI
jgi:hypothetical protein